MLKLAGHRVMKTSGLFLLASANLFVPAAQTPSPKFLKAPTYYIAAATRTCEPDEIGFGGASNLPVGSRIQIVVSDFDQDAWKDYSDEVYLSINRKGFFDGRIQPKNGFLFRKNLVLVVAFLPFRPTQPKSVLHVVGEKGEHLGGLENPQVEQVSGQNFYLQTIARVPNCGEGVIDRSR